MIVVIGSGVRKHDLIDCFAISRLLNVCEMGLIDVTCDGKKERHHNRGV
jgi:hypothetical protein